MRGKITSVVFAFVIVTSLFSGIAGASVSSQDTIKQPKLSERTLSAQDVEVKNFPASGTTWTTTFNKRVSGISELTENGNIFVLTGRDAMTLVKVDGETGNKLNSKTFSQIEKRAFEPDMLEYHSGTNAVYSIQINNNVNFGTYQVLKWDTQTMEMTTVEDVSASSFIEATANSSKLVYYDAPQNQLNVIGANGETSTYSNPYSGESYTHMDISAETGTAWLLNNQGQNLVAMNISNGSVVAHTTTFEGFSDNTLVENGYLWTIIENESGVVISIKDERDYLKDNQSSVVKTFTYPGTLNYPALWVSQNGLVMKGTETDVRVFAKNLAYIANIPLGGSSNSIADLQGYYNDGQYHYLIGVTNSTYPSTYSLKKYSQNYTVSEPPTGNETNGNETNGNQTRQICISEGLANKSTVTWIPCYVGTEPAGTTYQWLVFAFLVAIPITRFLNSTPAGLFTINAVMLLAVVEGRVGAGYFVLLFVCSMTIISYTITKDRIDLEGNI